MSWQHTSGARKDVEIEYGDTGAIDAFGRLRVSNPAGLFDSQLQYDDHPLLWEEVTSGGGSTTHIPNESAIRLTVQAGGSVVRQSRAYHRYQPGKSQYILMTFTLGNTVADVNRQIGYFDSNNGIFLEMSGTAIRLVLRAFTSGSVVNNVIEQADWNLDTFDGNGPSGIILDISKTQILVIDLEWLGVGRVRAGFNIDGLLIYAHEFLNANILQTTYMTTANLPLRYEIEAGGSAPAGNHNLLQICCGINSEGGFEDERGIPFIASNGVTTISVNARRPILSIRPRALFNSIANRGTIIPNGFNIFSDDNNLFFEIVYGGTLTNASFSDVDTTNSIVELDVAATAISGGIIVAAGYTEVGSGAGANRGAGGLRDTLLSKLPLALNVAGAHPTTPVTDSLTVVTETIPDAASDTGAVLSWRELR